MSPHIESKYRTVASAEAKSVVRIQLHMSKNMINDSANYHNLIKPHTTPSDVVYVVHCGRVL